MAALRDLIAFVLEMAAQGQSGEGGFDEHLAREIERQLQTRYPGERVYIREGTRKDPGRPARIAELARRLPTGVVAERLGVSRQYVHRVIARRK